MQRLKGKEGDTWGEKYLSQEKKGCIKSPGIKGAWLLPYLRNVKTLSYCRQSRAGLGRDHKHLWDMIRNLEFISRDMGGH